MPERQTCAVAVAGDLAAAHGDRVVEAPVTVSMAPVAITLSPTPILVPALTDPATKVRDNAVPSGYHRW